MSDNKTLKGGRDDNRIDINDPSEVEYVRRQFPNLKSYEVKQAIKEKGPLRADVMKYLRELSGLS